MTNVTELFKPAPTAEDALEAAKGKYEDAIIIGTNKDQEIEMITNLEHVADANLMMDVVKLRLLEG